MTGFAKWCGLWVGAGVLTIWMAGCLHVPDHKEMEYFRSEMAAKRVEDIETKASKENWTYLRGELHLRDAVEMALEQNRTLQKEMQEREIARGVIQESYATALPSLVWTGTYDRNDEESYSEVDGQIVTTRWYDNYRTGLRVTQPFFKGGSILAALRAAELSKELVEAGIRRVTEEVMFNVVSAYYTAALSSHLLEVHEVALETANSQLSDVRAKHRQGMASNYDVLRAEVEVANRQAQVIKSRNDYSLAYTSLFLLLGASPESEVELMDSIPLVIESMEFTEAVRKALTFRADLFEAEYALRLQREKVKVTRSRYLPTASGYASQTWGNPDPHNGTQNDWGDEWQAGVVLGWDIFDGFGRAGAMTQDRARLRQLEIEVQEMEETAINQVKKAVLTLKNAEEFATSQSKNLQMATEALRLVQIGMREGQNTQVEVMDARTALTEASGNYYQSLFDHVLARVVLQKAMGLLLPDYLPDHPVLQASVEKINEEDE